MQNLITLMMRVGSIIGLTRMIRARLMTDHRKKPAPCVRFEGCFRSLACDDCVPFAGCCKSSEELVRYRTVRDTCAQVIDHDPEILPNVSIHTQLTHHYGVLFVTNGILVLSCLYPAHCRTPDKHASFPRELRWSSRSNIG